MRESTNLFTTKANWWTHVKKYSPILLMFLLKREDPSYRDSYRAPEDDSGKVNLVDVIAAIQQGAH